jgi:phosphoribosylformylglycinamidine synthase
MVRSLVIRAPGSNCDQETAYAFELAGGKADVLHVNRLLERPDRLHDYQIVCFPGGFSYGDDIAAGRILGGQLRHHLFEPLSRFRDDGKLILGICNGFQILLKSGLLLSEDVSGCPQATLTWNQIGRFQNRWVRLQVTGEPNVFFRGIEELELPVAHAEGRFVARDATTLQQLERAGQIVLRYASAEGETDSVVSSTGMSTGILPFPANPNGSQANVAGVCDSTGRVVGLMPHPERNVDPTQHPQWTRRSRDRAAEGLRVFRNAVDFFA